MFIDKVKIKVNAGTGGNGMSSFRREKYVPKGGPDGGDGGRGGNIIFKADNNLSTLMELRYKKQYTAENGGNGKTKKMHGRDGKDTVIKVPTGSIIMTETGNVIADLNEHNLEVIVAKGGRGGRGNFRFATSRNSAPEFLEKGEPGQNIELVIELKLLADVGLVGLPSVGKSTLISVVSNCRPEIAEYHFTTIVPNLGMVRVKDGRSFVIADLPGLIEGASTGKGLGLQFLRHIERCRVIVHVVDMASVEGRDPYNDYQIIVNELKNYQVELLDRPQIIVANKMDLPEAKNNLEVFKEKVSDIEIVEISAINHSNLDILLYKIADILDKTPVIEFKPTFDEVAYYKYENEDAYTVKNLGNGNFVIEGAKIEKLVLMTSFAHEDSFKRFRYILKEMEVDKRLEEAGAKPGDTVKILDYEFEYTL